MEGKAERFMRKHMTTSMTVVAFVPLLIVRELVPRSTKAGMFPLSTSKIITKFISSFAVLIGKYTMPVHTGVSLYRVGVVFIIATLTGIALGVSMGYSKTAEATIKPIFEFIRLISPLTWIPMSILRFGLGDQSKFFIIFLGCFCFIVVNTCDGTKNVDPMLLGAARTLGASGCQVFFRVVLPSSVSYIFAGLQIAIAVGWSAVVGAEMVCSDEGVDWLTVMGMTNGNTVQVMAGMLAIGTIGYVLVTAMVKLEGRLYVWNQQQGL